MSRDRLLLLTPGFTDAQRPGQRFVCIDCLPVEGLLASQPEFAERLDIERLPFDRPRQAVIARLGEANQGLPVLILGDQLPPPDDALRFGDVRFVNDTRRILQLLSERHGFLLVH